MHLRREEHLEEDLLLYLKMMLLEVLVARVQMWLLQVLLLSAVIWRSLEIRRGHLRFTLARRLYLRDERVRYRRGHQDRPPLGLALSRPLVALSQPLQGSAKLEPRSVGCARADDCSFVPDIITRACLRIKLYGFRDTVLNKGQAAVVYG
jgi:hypothetical protein